MLNFINIFKDFFSYPIPLGVCVLIAVLLSIAVKYILESHRKSFKIAQEHKDKLIEQMMVLEDKAQKRIEELESKLDKMLEDKLNS